MYHLKKKVNYLITKWISFYFYGQRSQLHTNNYYYRKCTILLLLHKLYIFKSKVHFIEKQLFRRIKPVLTICDKCVHYKNDINIMPMCIRIILLVGTFKNGAIRLCNFFFYHITTIFVDYCVSTRVLNYSVLLKLSDLNLCSQH